MIVRTARLEDASAMALVIAEVAPEGVLGTEPPVDLDDRAQRFRRLIEEGGPAAMCYRRSDGSLRSTLMMGRLLQDAD